MHKFIVKRSTGGMWGDGATAARVTPDHKVGSSNLSGLILMVCVCYTRFMNHNIDGWCTSIRNGWLWPSECLWLAHGHLRGGAAPVIGGLSLDRPWIGSAQLYCRAFKGWHVGLWRNGSACDSRSQGWEFESLWPHQDLIADA